MEAATLEDRILLPTNVKPVRYVLKLSPDFETFTYPGEVTINLDVLEDSDEISLHMVDLKIESLSLQVIDSAFGTQAPKNTKYDKDSSVMLFTFKDLMKSGSKAILGIKFQGQLNDENAGFFRSSYVANDGTKKYCAYTQMEPTFARRAFPCFDEPALKATFEITLVVDREMTCLSNMNVISESTVDSRKKMLSFENTPLMSTFLVAFVICELEHIETDAFHIPIRVYALPGQENDGKYALDLAVRTLKFYEEAFQIPFPLPKMDMVAVPDFPGGMENWGLIIYKSNALLFNEQTSIASDKQRVAEIVQHELAHMWFGNLVTMDFWDGLWLKEGFATWMSWYSTNAFYPEWHVWQGYITDTLDRALQLDSLRSSHPIDMPVKSASDILQIFDAISYSKGSCVIRMISKYLGEDIFMEGIRRYLKKHAWGNTNNNDLWAALSDASGKEVTEIMEIWTQKVGYPVITVIESEKGIEVQQNRFLQTGDATAQEDSTVYPVLLTLSIAKGTSENVLFNQRNMSIPLRDLNFFKLNVNHSGIYRTLYAPERLLKLGEAMRLGLLDVEDRIGLVSDTAALATSGYQKTSALLGLLVSLKDESNSIVWGEIISRLSAIQSAWLFEPQETQSALKSFIRDLVSPKAHALGWDFNANDDILRQTYRVAMFQAAGLAGDEIIIDASKKMLSGLIKGDERVINPNLRKAVYAIAFQEANESDFDAVLDILHAPSTTVDEREDLLRGLGYFRDPKIIQKVLDLVLSDETISQDFYFPLLGHHETPTTASALWTWAKANLDALNKKIGQGMASAGRAVEITTRGLATAAQRADVRDFFNGDGDSGTTGGSPGDGTGGDGKQTAKKFELKLAQVLDRIGAKAGWVSRDKGDVEAWLVGRGYLAWSVGV